ncbi:DegT/DnrJ/EryC1/StrS family aminotransferase [Streptomyces uncialis]|uniref:DegT/DnrJ/EryC1/StrS family aminotransferase n=1 Tax=Streptomyces uncialis TaxID=1048205 RepID=UPI002E2F3A57|nr:DegT/DnrJ/EryC1/StrS family aminotransferase [Streptomyces uncialis]
MGTVAILRAAGIGPGDEVVVPSFGDIGLAGAVVAVGAAPVFADIDPSSYCLDADSMAAMVSPRTVAVVAVHRFGRPADLGRLRQLGRRHGLLVLEEDDEDTTPDALGVGELDELEQVRLRRARAAYFDSRLRGVRTPPYGDGHTYRSYVVRVPGNGRPDRDAFARALRARGVECAVPVRTPVHRMPGFRRGVLLPETERAAAETLALPMAASLTRRQVRRVVAACNALGGPLRAEPGFRMAAAF